VINAHRLRVPQVYWTGEGDLFRRSAPLALSSWRGMRPSSTCAHRGRRMPTIATTRCASSRSRKRG